MIGRILYLFIYWKPTLCLVQQAWRFSVLLFHSHQWFKVQEVHRRQWWWLPARLLQFESNKTCANFDKKFRTNAPVKPFTCDRLSYETTFSSLSSTNNFPPIITWRPSVATSRTSLGRSSCLCHQSTSLIISCLSPMHLNTTACRLLVINVDGCRLWCGIFLIVWDIKFYFGTLQHALLVWWKKRRNRGCSQTVTEILYLFCFAFFLVSTFPKLCNMAWHKVYNNVTWFCPSCLPGDVR